MVNLFSYFKRITSTIVSGRACLGFYLLKMVTGVTVNGVERLRAKGINTLHGFEYCHIKEGTDFCGVALGQW